MGRNLCGNFISITRTRQVWNGWLMNREAECLVIWFKLPRRLSLSFRILLNVPRAAASLLSLLHHKDRSGWVKEREREKIRVAQFRRPIISSVLLCRTLGKGYQSLQSGHRPNFNFHFVISDSQLYAPIGWRNSQPREREREKLDEHGEFYNAPLFYQPV